MKYLRPALVLTLFFVLFTGLVFPLVITGVAQAAMPHQANGSMVKVNGQVVGSDLIGQNFTAPKYFHPRPSAAGNGYDANNSGGTNLGPTNPKLLEGADGFDGIKQLAVAYRAENGLATNMVLPADAVTRSASGLDPHISPENARLQVDRVARARGLDPQLVSALVAKHTETPFLGIFGDSRVNVLAVNRDLDSSR